MENEALENNINVNLDDLFLQKQIELIIETNNRKIAKELDNLKNIINKLNNDISELKIQVNENRNNRIGPSQIIIENKPKIDTTTENKEASQTKNEPPSRAKVGNYRPEEIKGALDKLFYFDKKRV